MNEELRRHPGYCSCQCGCGGCVGCGCPDGCGCGVPDVGGPRQAGVLAYDLPMPFCPECRRPLGNRWLMSGDSGCATCDEAVTRHRCLSRPRLEALAVGKSWRCRECWSVWTVTEEEDTCGHCGRSGPEKTWAYAAGARADEAPRYKPVVFTPFRNVIPPPAGPCHRTAGGIMIHVKPDCRCR